jgi:hypothetical protein
MGYERNSPKADKHHILRRGKKTSRPASLNLHRANQQGERKLAANRYADEAKARGCISGVVS